MGAKGSGTTRGYASPKRNEIQQDLDRCRLAELLREGWTKRAIADELGVCPATITKDYKTMIKEWHDDRDINLDQFITIKLEELSLMKRRAWEAYKASKIILKPVYKEDPKSGKLTLEMVETPCEGNSNHIRVALEALKEECELLGAYPSKGSSKGGVPANQTTINWQVLMAGIPTPGESIPLEVESDIERLLQESQQRAIQGAIQRAEAIETTAQRGNDG